MRKLLFASAATFLLSFGYGVGTTSAAPMSPASVVAPDSGIAQARMHRKRMMRKRGMRRSMMRRGGVARSSTGTNVSQPARMVPQTGPGGGGGGR